MSRPSPSATSTPITAVSEATGAGSAARGKHILGDLLCRATDEEAGFVKRDGRAAAGTLAGRMVDAVAKAVAVPGALVCRALMLSGDLARTGEVALAEGEEGLRGINFELFRPILPMLASAAESAGDTVASFDPHAAP